MKNLAVSSIFLSLWAKLVQSKPTELLSLFDNAVIKQVYSPQEELF